ncbi:TraR/DksA C4-type zinc finger protein [Pasteurella multocida]|uniref:TraR/DksA C4-type zinc finger protein n=1 Tax=Pasteurella multocida TaxID=747 RepID=UPI000C18F65B|nr:TraR/DksA C4-type zinc finger protein [Pasteurella multocida]HEH9616937.1 TraR/DksA C4-type zinc finger protein [Pasteurella multocida]HEH9663188.1 TraR/DksA C4-type zinc finger protein [Pasteurella multocida]HEH9676826.1 TraR/DksA C4-type zinc finger protein [Pasteurella multocida]HEH9690170.1 TraR/DksA C4-type zinc finger protein [Pasteurella multocida]HEH9699362.1 TraR/DksA C4-type zinc finger protein [Pasteurella multocida]
MSDIADVTQEREERMMNDFLNRITRTEKPVEVLERNCIDCGEAIPLQRLRAVPHCVRCVYCQGNAEK